MIDNTRLLALLFVSSVLTSTAVAQPPPQTRLACGKATSLSGSVSARQPNATGFEVLSTDSALFSGDLLVALPGATLVSKNGAIGLKSFADFDGQSPLPIFETALILDEAKDCDFAFALDRGRIDVTNIKPEGPATVRVRFWDQVWTLTLDVPGTRVALELIGRWPAGARFRPIDPVRPGMAQVPVASLVVLVLKGSPSIGIGEFTLGMKAPPGPALIEWDSLAGARPEPKRLEQVPEWAHPESNISQRARKTAQVLDQFRIARAKDPTTASRMFLDSPDPLAQRVAIITLGAFDDLEELVRELSEARTIDRWDVSITVLRHWLGRCPGQDQKLYQTLITRGYDPTSARIVLQLLFGLSRDELMQPETYDVLIEYLRHDRPAIRNLSAWHLIRAVPLGKAIPFKPNGSKADAERNYEAWRKLIPPGQLPPTDMKK